MTLKTSITNGSGTAEAEIHTSSNDERGLLVFAKNRDEVEFQTKPFLNDTYGIDMAKNGSGTVTVTDNIHDGIDNTYWTATAISGTWTFDSTAQNHTPAGTKSIDATAANNNNRARIDKGAPTALTPYSSVTGWIYITGWSTGGTLKDIQIEFRDAAAALVGSTLLLSAYINTTTFNVWQQYTIPLSDFGLTNQSIQSIDLINRDQGAGAAPNWYMDDIALIGTASGAPELDYTIEPDFGTRFHIARIKFLISDAYSVTTSNQHGFGIDSFLGLSALTNGVLAARLEQGEIVTSANIKTIGDWMAFPQVQNVVSGGDGTNTWISFDLAFTLEGGLVLDSRRSDSFLYRIRDDMSGLNRFQAIAEGYIVTNEPEGF